MSQDVVVNTVRPGRPYGRVGGLFAGLGITALLVLLAMLPAAADRVVLDWLAAHRTGPLTGVLTVVSALGGITVMGLLALVVAAAAGATARSWRPVAFVAAAVVGSAVLAAAVKAVVDRPRPPVTQALVAANGPGFPSEHAVRAVVVLGAGAVLAGRAGRRRMRTALAAGAAVLTLLVGFSRVYLGVHRPSDVVAGAVLGFGWLLAAWVAAGLYDRDRPARR